MKKALILALLVLAGCNKRVVKITYPEKFEGLTQLVLASETRTMSFTDTTVMKVLGFAVSSAQVRIMANVTYDFYLDFDKDGYRLVFNQTGDELKIEAPPLRVKRPVINNTSVSYPVKGVLINKEEVAVKRLETLTDEFVGEGEALLKEEYVVRKCTEMLQTYLLDLCRKMGYRVNTVVVEYRKHAV